MYEDETMVEMDDNVEADDTLPEDIVEDEDESEDEVQYLDDDQDEEEPQDSDEPEEEEEEQKQPSEPGWIKQRVNKAVEKALAQQKAEFEKMMAPIREKMMEDEAQELVRTRKVSDIETARELVRYRQGQAQQPEPEQPRDEQGRFTSQEEVIEQARTQARIDELRKQAAKIKAAGGPDVIAEFSENEDIKKRVINEELDFYDVADIMRKNTRRRPPSPMRTPNGVNGIGQNSIESMTDAQFRKLDKMLDEGVRFTQRR